MRRDGSRRAYLALVLVTARACALSVVLLLIASLALSGGAKARPNGTTSLHYSALGDSISSPAWNLFGITDYVPIYADGLGADLGVDVSSDYYSAPGWDSSALLNAVSTNRGWQSTISRSHAITLFIGFNDLYGSRLSTEAGTCGGPDNEDCYRAAYTAFRSNFDALLGLIASLHPDHETLVRVLTIYNPFTAIDRATGASPAFERYVQEFNAHIYDASLTRGFLVVDIYAEFNGRTGTFDPVARNLIYADEKHPSSAGQELIARALRSVRYAPLDSSVPVTCIGDVNRDARVNSADSLLVALRIDTRKGDSRYAVEADVDNDGAVDAGDHRWLWAHTGRCRHG